MKNLTMKTVFATLAAAAAVITVAVTPATATPAPAASGAGDFCVINVEHASAPTCFPSPARLMAAETGQTSTQATQYLIARLYDNRDYNTAAGYLEVYAPSGCTGATTNIDFQIVDLGSWKDRISSFKSFGLCAAKLWTGTNFNGSAYPSTGSFQANSTYIGNAMNDHTRSIQFS